MLFPSLFFFFGTFAVELRRLFGVCERKKERKKEKKRRISVSTGERKKKERNKDGSKVDGQVMVVFEALRGEGAQKARILALRDGSGVREPNGRKRGKNKGKKTTNKIHKTFFLLSLSPCLSLLLSLFIFSGVFFQLCTKMLSVSSRPRFFPHLP